MIVASKDYDVAQHTARLLIRYVTLPMAATFVEVGSTNVAPFLSTEQISYNENLPQITPCNGSYGTVYHCVQSFFAGRLH